MRIKPTAYCAVELQYDLMLLVAAQYASAYA